jgi:hypothetical protein
MVSLLFGVVAIASETAEAQRRGRVIIRHRPRVVYVAPRPFYRRPFFGYNRFYVVPQTHVTEGQGYRDGLNDGEDDAEEGKGYTPYSHNSYKNAQSDAYISGFLRGYAEGYRRHRGVG